MTGAGILRFGHQEIWLEVQEMEGFEVPVKQGEVVVRFQVEEQEVLFGESRYGAVREQVMSRAGADEIKRSAIERDLETLRMDGARKVKAGETSIAEVLRVTQTDIM